MYLTPREIIPLLGLGPKPIRIQFRIGGPPGSGKTTFVANLVANLATELAKFAKFADKTSHIIVIDETGSNQTTTTQIVGPPDGKICNKITFVTNCCFVTPKQQKQYKKCIFLGLDRYKTFAEYVQMLLGREFHSLRKVVLSQFEKGGLQGVLKWFKSRFKKWGVEYEKFNEKIGRMSPEALVLYKSLIDKIWLSPLKTIEVSPETLDGKFTFCVGQKGRSGFNPNPPVGSNIIYLAFVFMDGRHLTLRYYGRKNVSVDDAKSDLMEAHASMVGEETPFEEAGKLVTVTFQKAIDAPNATYYKNGDVIRHASKKEGSLKLFGCYAPVLNGNKFFTDFVENMFRGKGEEAEPSD